MDNFLPIVRRSPLSQLLRRMIIWVETAPRARVISLHILLSLTPAQYHAAAIIRLSLHGYFSKRNSSCPALVLASLQSMVPSVSGLAALKRDSTIAKYSSFVSVPSLSGSPAARSFFDRRPCSSFAVTVPSLSVSRLSNSLVAAAF